MPRAFDLPDPVDLVVGERLRAARLANGMSQADLGKAMDLSFQQVQKYERATNRISASMLFRAARALGKPVADFFPDDVESPDILSVQGGTSLAECFLAMDPELRLVLLQVARQFARSPDSGGYDAS